MQTPKTYNLLFLCTGNSARSILAEALTNRAGKGRLRAYSAGSHPTGRVNPHALALLKRLGFATEDFRSKTWDEFAAPGAPPLDFVVTVCDNAAGEVCPIWPGRPATAHWGVEDPAAAEGTEAQIDAAFAETYRRLKARIDRLAGLPIQQLDGAALKRELQAIGETNDLAELT